MLIEVGNIKLDIKARVIDINGTPASFRSRSKDASGYATEHTDHGLGCRRWNGVITNTLYIETHLHRAAGYFVPNPAPKYEYGWQGVLRVEEFQRSFTSSI